MRRYRETERMEQDRLKRIRDKEEKLADWIRKKEEEMKGEGYVAKNCFQRYILGTKVKIPELNSRYLQLVGIGSTGLTVE